MVLVGENLCVREYADTDKTQLQHVDVVAPGHHQHYHFFTPQHILIDTDSHARYSENDLAAGEDKGAKRAPIWKALSSLDHNLKLLIPTGSLMSVYKYGYHGSYHCLRYGFIYDDWSAFNEVLGRELLDFVCRKTEGFTSA